MTQDQIKQLSYCQGYLASLKKWKESLPFKIQHYGCSSGSPLIEHRLQKLHEQMYSDVWKIINEKEKQVQSIIDEL